MTRAALAVFLVLLSYPVDAQTRSAVGHWIQKSYEAAERYRAGDVILALELLRAMTSEEQAKAVDAIKEQMERFASGLPPRKGDVVHWQANAVRALAALHMEGAVAARLSRDPGIYASSVAGQHMTLANTLFGVLFLIVKVDDHAAARWLLAMGLESMAAANFLAAQRILTPACAEYDDYAPLILACGSLHETCSSLPANHGALLPGDDLKRMLLLRPAAFENTLSPSARTLGNARGLRKEHLGLARKYLERAIALDDKDAEAPLRLANVHVQQGNYQDAGRILEGLLARPSIDTRQSYLARLFLARVRDRENRLDDAAAILAKAPPRQSALLARAHNAVRRGNTKEAALFADRASDAALDDAWWGYRFGQFWVPDELYKQLREEARK